MSARQMKGSWWVDFHWEKERIRKKSPINTKRGAEEYERRLRTQLLETPADAKEVPTFDNWFKNRFWREWVVARKNKPSEVEAKESIYRVHLKVPFGDLRLDEIRTTEIASLRAHLVEQELSDKRINNIMAVLSKALRYAADAGLITHAPKVGLFKVERPEIIAWEMEEYARVLSAARDYAREWYAAVALSGEAGLRIGEVKELRWRDDVDLIGRTITINRQVRRGIVGTPKGRTRRVIPMTDTLFAALSSLKERPRELVLNRPPGSPHMDYETRHVLDLIYDRAGLSRRGWHILRHTFGTHAALFGVNPWRLMAWMGHKRIEETLLYVHVADSHRRTIPPQVLAAGAAHPDPDHRVLAMLAARGHLMGTKQAAGGGSPTIN